LGEERGSKLTTQHQIHTINIKANEQKTIKANNNNKKKERKEKKKAKTKTPLLKCRNPWVCRHLRRALFFFSFFFSFLF
jgi:hypothetical protein